MSIAKSQGTAVIEELKLAILSHTPIVYIPTDQLELISELLFNKNDYCNSLIPRLVYDNEKKVSYPLEAGVFGETTDSGSFAPWNDNYVVNPSDCSKLSHPSLFLKFSDDWDNNACSIIKNYLNLYLGLKGNYGYPDPRKVEYARRSLFIFVSPKEKRIPDFFLPYVKTIRIPALSNDEIEEIINKCLDEGKIPEALRERKLIDNFVANCRGLSSFRIRQIFDQLIASQTIDFDIIDSEKAFAAIRYAKRQMLDGFNGLKWENVPQTTNAAGLDNIDKWIGDRRGLFDDTEKAKSRHIDIPNGILVSGIPGSGKSLIAKATAIKLGLPLISLDMGALLGGIMGESEHNMIQALQIADNMSPCVLWIDEIEKAFSGSSQSSSSSDGGVGRRMFGKFLTWMQEKSSACFVFATSNDIGCLPPELFRSERFDRKFFTFMPMVDDCAAIMASNIQKQNKDYQDELLSLPKDAKKQMPGSLFSEELESPSVWKKLLNDVCSFESLKGSRLVKNKESGIFLWETGKRPSSKLFTGADLASIIKEAKFKVSSSSNGSMEAVYTKDEMLKATQEVIRTFKPYGETNLYDIVKCFRTLYENRFVSASKQCILNFDHYDPEGMIYTPDESEADGFTDNYNSVLFATIVGAINHYAVIERKRI